MEGRLDDEFVYQDGVRVHPHLFRTVLARRRAITEYQVEQTARGARIRVVLAEGTGTLDDDRITDEVRDHLAAPGIRNADVNVENVARCPRLPSVASPLVRARRRPERTPRGAKLGRAHANGAGRRGPRRRARRTTPLLLLFLIGVFNAMDRHILVVLLEPIRLEFGASTRDGRADRVAFVFLLALVAPIARLSDVRRRTSSSSGFGVERDDGDLRVCRTYWQLAVARVGVGVGETWSLPSEYVDDLRESIPAGASARSR